MAAADAIVAQLQAQRRVWAALDAAQPDGRAVQLETPSQFGAVSLAAALRSGDGDGAARAVCSHAADWRGISQADLLGPAVGSADQAPFDPRLLAIWLADRPDDVGALAVKLLEMAAAAQQRAQGARGN